MGGKGSGGARAGAGRPPKSAAERALHGTLSKKDRERLAATGSLTGTAPAEVVLPPKGLPEDQLEVWMELSPFAHAARTLAPSTAVAFRDLCEAIVVRRELLKAIQLDGYTLETEAGLKAHPLLTQHRGMMQRVEAAMLRFKLSPMGKELEGDEKPPADPFSEFDQPAGAVN